MRTMRLRIEIHVYYIYKIDLIENNIEIKYIHQSHIIIYMNMIYIYIIVYIIIYIHNKIILSNSIETVIQIQIKFRIFISFFFVLFSRIIENLRCLRKTFAWKVQFDSSILILKIKKIKKNIKKSNQSF